MHPAHHPHAERATGQGIDHPEQVKAMLFAAASGGRKALGAPSALQHADKAE